MEVAEKEGTLIVQEPSRARRDDPAANPIALQSPGAAGLLQAVTQAVSLSRVDMSQVERLYAMVKEIKAQEAEAAYNDAMARAQANIVPVVRNKRNTHTNSTYADLAAICDAIVPIYSAEGLAVSFDTETKNDADPIPEGEYRTVAIITHRLGHKAQRHIDLALDDAGSAGNKNKTKVQAKGSTTSYGRRYLLLMIFNVSTNDDNDGNRKREHEEIRPDPEGKAKLEACGSMTALQEAWKGLTVEQRKTLGEVKNSCKTRIEDADRT